MLVAVKYKGVVHCFNMDEVKEITKVSENGWYGIKLSIDGTSKKFVFDDVEVRNKLAKKLLSLVEYIDPTKLE